MKQKSFIIFFFFLITRLQTVTAQFEPVFQGTYDLRDRVTVVQECYIHVYDRGAILAFYDSYGLATIELNQCERNSIVAFFNTQMDESNKNEILRAYIYKFYNYRKTGEEINYNGYASILESTMNEVQKRHQRTNRQAQANKQQEIPEENTGRQEADIPMNMYQKGGSTKNNVPEEKSVAQEQKSNLETILEKIIGIIILIWSIKQILKFLLPSISEKAQKEREKEAAMYEEYKKKGGA